MFKVLLLSPALVIAGIVSQQPGAPPPMPADAATLVNPLKGSAAGLEHAKKLYAIDCAMCHGANGDGKGDLAGDMKPPLKDFTDPSVLKDVPDGELFYAIKNGKGMMPGEGERTKTDDVWNLAILVRSFSKH
jgi:mono/diheme cytochrome c family protein